MQAVNVQQNSYHPIANFEKHSIKKKVSTKDEKSIQKQQQKIFKNPQKTLSPSKSKSYKSAKKEIAQNVEIIINSDKTVTVIKKAPSLKYAGFEGGGAKGIVYPTFLRVLNELAPFLDGLEKVAGTSAGAMMAYLLAVGVPIEKIEEFLTNVDMLDMLRGNAPLGTRLGRGVFSAGLLTYTLKNMGITSASTYYKEVKNTKLLDNISSLEFYKKFKEHADSNFKEGLTFFDLEFLKRLNPSKFKSCEVIGYEQKTDSLVYFGILTTPDTFVHNAVRASIAIPTLFKSFKFKDQGIDRDISDGGLRSNVPYEIFSSQKDFKNEETVLFVFDRKGTSYKILHDPKKDGWHGPKTSWLRALILGKGYVQAEKTDAQEIYSSGPNAFVVPHGKDAFRSLGTVSFSASKSRIEEAKNDTKKMAKEYGQLRQKLAVHTVYNSLKEAKKDESILWEKKKKEQHKQLPKFHKIHVTREVSSKKFESQIIH